MTTWKLFGSLPQIFFITVSIVGPVFVVWRMLDRSSSDFMVAVGSIFVVLALFGLATLVIGTMIFWRLSK